MTEHSEALHRVAPIRLGSAAAAAAVPGAVLRVLHAVTVLAAIGAVLVGCRASNQSPASAPPEVSVARPLQRDIVDWDEYIGHFEAPQAVNLRARVTGVVTQILFKDGQDVRQGQPLIVVDPRPYRATLMQAKAQVASATAALANAKSIEARSEKLVQSQAVSKEELENDQATVRTAAANLQAAEANAYNADLNFGFTTVRSPIAGRVSNRRISLGDQITNGDTLLTTVMSLDPIWFSFDGAESFYLHYMREAKQGGRKSSRIAANPIDIQLSDETGFNHHGSMAFVDNAADPGSGTIKAHAVVANPDHFLTPGIFGRARLLGSGTYRGLLVPEEVISTDQSRKVILVVTPDGKLTLRVVELGPLAVGLRVVRAGLAPTDDVVTGGAAVLPPGTSVRIKRGMIAPRAQDDTPSPTVVQTPEASSASISATPAT